jgi:hypothetical protein
MLRRPTAHSPLSPAPADGMARPRTRLGSMS